MTAGGAWDADGTIVFTLTINGPLSRISEAGGPMQAVSTLDTSRGEHSHLWPQILPEGRGILVTMGVGEDFQDFEDSQIVVLDPKSGRRNVVLEGSSFARYAAGQIVFVRGGSMFRAPFDLTRLAVTGPPILLAERVTIDSEVGSASFAVTTDGTLVYADGPATADPRSVVVRLDRRGVEKPVPLPEAFYADPRLSPDGKTLAFGKCDGPSCDLVLYDLERILLTPLTVEPGRFFNPVWSADGRRLAYSGFAVGAPTLYVKNADGSGRAERPTNARTEARETAEFPNSWSPDGRTIAYIQVHGLSSGKAQRDVCVVSPDGKRQEGRCFATPYAESPPPSRPTGDGWRTSRMNPAARRFTCAPFRGPADGSRSRTREEPNRSGRAAGASSSIGRETSSCPLTSGRSPASPPALPNFSSRATTVAAGERMGRSGTPSRRMETRSTPFASSRLRRSSVTSLS